MEKRGIGGVTVKVDSVRVSGIVTRKKKGRGRRRRNLAILAQRQHHQRQHDSVSLVT